MRSRRRRSTRSSTTSTRRCRGTSPSSARTSWPSRGPRTRTITDEPMPTMNIIEAVRNALQTQMRLDPRVVVLGEDVGKFGGVFRATSGLHEEFGADRVIDTPLAEAGIIGTSIGMALYGLRPVPEIQFADFIYPAYDQIVNELAKFRYRSGR